MSKNAFRIGSAAALLGAAALVLPAAAGAAPGSLGSLDPGSSGGSSGSSGGFTCSALSTEDTPNGWGIPFDDELGQDAFYTADTVFDDDGSLELRVDGPTDRSVSYHEAGGIELSDAITEDIAFAEKRAGNSIAAFQLRLTGTTDNTTHPVNGFTTLVWEATYNGGADATTGVTNAALEDGLWWSTSNIAGAQNRVPVSLASIAAANPDAVVDHYGVGIGTGAAATSTLVDEVTFNGCTTNFALEDPESSSLGSLGSLDLFGSLSTLFGSLNGSSGSLGS
ncbi:hypothetical protein [Prescottella sp. R16]|uniref:hypothetical protein n=1 Tax=Prescottella sp. R16 TaxID=3064529 RepID=UPI00272EDECC|nr:hypothetical protein [Prescottella sp. R16]